MDLSDTEEKWITEYIEHLAKFMQKKTDVCLHCGKKVTQLKQIGRCVYGEPCGCRMFQGKVPPEWKGK